MDVVVTRCAGLDVHRDTVVATVRGPGKRRGSRSQETRTFATTMRGLSELGDWLVLERVELAAMEATGIYWKPVFAVLEGRMTCWLLNAQHMHNVPGRVNGESVLFHGGRFKRREAGIGATRWHGLARFS